MGRALARVALGRADLELVAINDRMPARSLAGLLARDSVHGRFPGVVEAADGALIVDGRRIPVFQHEDPAAIPWDGTGALVVVEATGAFTRRRAAARHLRTGGPRRVLVSAIVDDAEAAMCPGLESAVAPEAQVISGLSCTSHCLALLLDVLDRGPGIERALMNEVHSYTADQCLLDGDHNDARRARSAAINIVPTRTAAPTALAKWLPRFNGRLDGMAVRVPTPNVALLELVATLSRPSEVSELRRLFVEAAAGRHVGLLAVTEDPLVSSDIVGDPASALVDLELITSVGDLCRVVAWYDNEWGYAHRLADFLATLGAEEAVGSVASNPRETLASHR